MRVYNRGGFYVHLKIQVFLLDKHKTIKFVHFFARKALAINRTQIEIIFCKSTRITLQERKLLQILKSFDLNAGERIIIALALALIELKNNTYIDV